MTSSSSEAFSSLIRLYRISFVLGVSLVAAACLGGLAHELVNEHKLPAATESHFSRAERLLEEGRFEEALLEFKVGTRVRPDLDEGFLGLARALEEAGRVEEEIQVFEGLLSVRPRNKAARAGA